MKKMVALTLALLMAASLFLSGCSVRKDTSDSENSGSSNGSGSGDRVVNVCSWGEYIDESLIDQFEEATGIKVNYQTAESNEVLYSQLSMGGVDYDVIVPSDYMISQLIEEDMLAELNYDNIPNFEKIDDRPTPGALWASSTIPPRCRSPLPAGAPCSIPSTPGTCCLSTTPGMLWASPCCTWGTL